MPRIARLLPALVAALLSILPLGAQSPAIPAAAAASTRGVALVVGNAAYSEVKALANPVNDATDIGAALKTLGW